MKDILNSNTELKWHFPELQHADSEGINDPLLQYFVGDYNRYIAREVIQNSVDAREDNSKPVVVRFKKFKINTDETPGLLELTKHLKVCLLHAEAEQNDKAIRCYKDALEATSKKETVVLRASDYNTKGLDGSDRDKKGSLHRLVKAVGENRLTGAGGGSYGIGKGAPFAASSVRTVYYSTLNGEGEKIFIGKTRLTSHELDEVEYRGVGSFGGGDGHESVRDVDQIPEIFQREERGTDINIIGYNGSLHWDEELIVSVLENFWMAIHTGVLEVVIEEGLISKSINKSTLYGQLEKHCLKKAFQYYRAVVNPTRVFKKQLPILGDCKLYVKIEDKFPKKVVLMRQPKMSVDYMLLTKALREPYAAVFICDDTEGNKLLRDLEPPEHDKWDPSLDKEKGRKIMTEIREWIRGNLITLAVEEGGDPEEIPGLDELLPYDEDTDKETSVGKNRTVPSMESGDDETPYEVGARKEDIETEIKDTITRPSMSRQGGGLGQGVKKREKRKGGGDGEGGSGGDEGEDGEDKINTTAIRFRVIYSGDVESGSEYCLILESEIDQIGGLSIVAAGEDGTLTKVPVVEAGAWSDNSIQYPTKNSFIKDVELKKGETLKLRIKVASNSRYALGIESHEN
jgi:hypothetical protein